MVERWAPPRGRHRACGADVRRERRAAPILRLRGAPAGDAALSPDGKRARARARPRPGRAAPEPARRPARCARCSACAGCGNVSWSPNGTLAARSAGRPPISGCSSASLGAPRVTAVSRIAQQFSERVVRRRGRPFPQLDGWCCTGRARPDERPEQPRRADPGSAPALHAAARSSHSTERASDPPPRPVDRRVGAPPVTRTRPGSDRHARPEPAAGRRPS